MRTLELVFTLDSDATKTYSLQDPKEGLTEAETRAAMQKMIDAEAIDAGGAKAVAIKETYIRISDREALV